TWMVENLKVTHLNDGTTIPNVTDVTAWGVLTTLGYCWYNNDASNKATFGALYNWYATINSKLCPVGWHVPIDDEWTTLTTYLGGISVAGGKLKETGTAHWATPNTGADNSSGFTALPGGSHYSNGLFYLNGQYGWYWSSTESSSTEAWHVYMQNSTTATTRKGAAKNLGFSIRCIKN
ncbi:MAG TPA: fibrobacter succinogenes major paralogous domain-containing protein, partial [Prolixibacteraceae bacterium]